MTGRWNGERVGSHDGWLLYVGGDGKRVHVVWSPEAEIQAISNLALAVYRYANPPRIPNAARSIDSAVSPCWTYADNKNYCSNTVENEKTSKIRQRE